MSALIESAPSRALSTASFNIWLWCYKNQVNIGFGFQNARQTHVGRIDAFQSILENVRFVHGADQELSMDMALAARLGTTIIDDIKEKMIKP